MKNTLKFWFISATLWVQPLLAQQINYPIPLQEIADNARLGCFGGLDCIPSIEFPSMVPNNVATYINEEENDLFEMNDSILAAITFQVSGEEELSFST